MVIRALARVLVGVLFCMSAVAKLVAIDDFELYVYSFGWLPLNMSYVAARLCIGWEMVLGGLMLSGWWRKTTRTAVLMTLVLFSLFLCYAALVGRNESCECFGRLLEMNPTMSLLKNGVLIVLVLFAFSGVGRQTEVVAQQRKRWKIFVGAAVGLVLMAVPFVVSVPDSWGFGPDREPYGEAELREAMSEEGALAQMGVGEGRHLVVFVTPNCPYCKLARKKLGALESRHHLRRGRIVYVEPADIGEDLWVKITFGSRPLMLLVDGQEVRATYHLRNVDEEEVSDFLR